MVLRSPLANASDEGARADNSGEPSGTWYGSDGLGDVTGESGVCQEGAGQGGQVRVHAVGPSAAQEACLAVGDVYICLPASV